MRSLILSTLFCLELAACQGGDGTPPPDAAPSFDADPVCATQDSIGGFPSCEVCTANGNGCDTIDDNGQVSRVCDCTASCPCGTRCGDYELAPNIVISNVCIF